MSKSRKRKSKNLNGFQMKQKLQQELRPKPVLREIDVFIHGEGRSEAFTFSVEDLKNISSNDFLLLKTPSGDAGFVYSGKGNVLRHTQIIGHFLEAPVERAPFMEKDKGKGVIDEYG